MKWARYAFSLVTLAIVIYLFWPLTREFKGAFHLFRTANYFWLPVILLIQLVSYGFLTWLNQLTLRPFDGKIQMPKLSALLTSMAFIEVAIPSAGASGIALRARLLGVYGYSVEASTFTLFLETIYLGIAQSTVAVLGIGYLLQEGELTFIKILWFVLLLALLAGLIVWAWSAFQDPKRSHAVAAKMIQFWNRFRKSNPLKVEDIDHRLALFREELGALKSIPVSKFLLAAFLRVLFDVLTLQACFLMFRHLVPVGTLFTGYGLMLVMSGLAALPGGLGMADASVPVIFARLGEAGAFALAGGLTYRLVAFWLVRFIGFISWQALEDERGRLANSKGV